MSEGMRDMRTSEKRQQHATKPQSKQTPKRVRLIGRGVTPDEPIDDATDREEAAVNDLVADFNDGWRMSVDGIFKAGGALAQLKKHLKHKKGAFARVLEERLKITDRTAQRLIAIATDPVLKTTHVSHPERLPRSWGTLYEMTKLPEHRLEQALDSGKINAGTERNEVEAIYAECRDIIKLDRVPEAFSVLREFMDEYPDAKDFASRVFDHFEEGEFAISFDAVGAVVAWATEMHLEFKYIISERERLADEPRVNAQMKAESERQEAAYQEKQRKRKEKALADKAAEETVR